MGRSPRSWTGGVPRFSEPGSQGLSVQFTSPRPAISLPSWRLGGGSNGCIRKRNKIREADLRLDRLVPIKGAATSVPVRQRQEKRIGKLTPQLLGEGRSSLSVGKCLQKALTRSVARGVLLMWVKSRLFIPISTMISQSKIIISIIFRYSCLRFDRPFPTEYLRPQRVLIVEVLGSGILASGILASSISFPAR